MQNANIKIRIDSEIKQYAQKFAKNLGVSLNTLLVACLHRFVKTRKLHLNNKDIQAIIKEVKANH